MTDKATLAGQYRTRHPAGLWILFFSELWERFCFYGMRALLVLYMTSDVLQKGSKEAYGIYAAYGALVYATPLLGGFLADRVLGTRLAVILGGCLMASGEFAMMIYDERVLYAALGLICVGNGFFKPNISSTVGQLYAPGDPMRDRGFTLFYMGINIGAFLAPLACGALGEGVDWKWGFGLAGVGIVVGLLVFLRGQHLLGDAGLPPDRARAKRAILPILAGVLLLLLPAIYLLLENHEFSHHLLNWLAVATALYVLWFAFTNEAVVRDRTLVFLMLAFFHTMFWALFEQAGSSLTVYARDCVDRGIAGWTMPTSYTQSFNPLFIILFAPAFAWLWGWLSRRGKEPSIPMKFGLGLVQLGLGYYVLVIGAASGLLSSVGLVMLVFLVFCYLLHTTGELCISPVGLSAVTKLMPAHVVSFFMGIWFFSISMAHNLAGQIAKLTGESEAFQVNAEVREAVEIEGEETLPNLSPAELKELNQAVDAQLAHLGVKVESKNQFTIDLARQYNDDQLDLMAQKLNIKLSDLVTAFRPGEGELPANLLRQLDRNVDAKIADLMPALRELDHRGVVDLSHLVDVQIPPDATPTQLDAAAEGIRTNVEVLVQGALSGYTDVWTYCAYGAVAAGVLLIVASPAINKLAHGVR